MCTHVTLPLQFSLSHAILFALQLENDGIRTCCYRFEKLAPSIEFLGNKLLGQINLLTRVGWIADSLPSLAVADDFHPVLSNDDSTGKGNRVMSIYNAHARSGARVADWEKGNGALVNGLAVK